MRVSGTLKRPCPGDSLFVVQFAYVHCLENETKVKVDVNAARRRKEEFQSKMSTTKNVTAKPITFGDKPKEPEDEEHKPKISAAEAKSKKEEFQKRFQTGNTGSADKLEELKKKYKQTQLDHGKPTAE